MIPAERNPLTPRETAQRMLEHMHDDVSYQDIVRQLRILQDIESTLNDVEMAGSSADEAVQEAQSELGTHPDDLDAPSDEGKSSIDGPGSLILRSSRHKAWEWLSESPPRARDALLREAVWSD